MFLSNCVSGGVPGIWQRRAAARGVHQKRHEGCSGAGDIHISNIFYYDAALLAGCTDISKCLHVMLGADFQNQSHWMTHWMTRSPS